MTLKHYLALLNEITKANPEILEYEVVYSKDDEGNEFNQVLFSPCIGRFEDRNFTSETKKPNAVCLN